MASITLPERCDRAASEELLAQLRAAPSGPLLLDARDVSQFGQAMLQVLVSARKSRPDVTIEASQVVRETAHHTGLFDILFGGGAA